MNIGVEKKVSFLKKECGKKGVSLLREDFYEPIRFVALTNERGDMASVSENGTVFESHQYIPEWSESMKQWAKEEGFSDKQIESQNLIHNVSIEEAADLLS